MRVNSGSPLARDFRRLAIRKGSILWLFLLPLAGFTAPAWMVAGPGSPAGLLSEQRLAGWVGMFYLGHVWTVGVLRHREHVQLRRGMSLPDYWTLHGSRMLLGMVQLAFVALAAWAAFRKPLPSDGVGFLLVWLVFSGAATSLALLWGSLSWPRAALIVTGALMAATLSLLAGFADPFLASPLPGNFPERVPLTGWLLAGSRTTVTPGPPYPTRVLLELGALWAAAVFAFLGWTGRRTKSPSGP